MIVRVTISRSLTVNVKLNAIGTGGGSGADELVKYDNADPAAGYLSDKIIAGTGITLEEGTGANENKLKISSTAVGTDEKVKYDSEDPTAGYLSAKIVAGTNISITEGTGADENKAKISFTGSIPTKAAGSDIATGTDDAKYMTAKSLKDSGLIDLIYAGL